MTQSNATCPIRITEIIKANKNRNKVWVRDGWTLLQTEDSLLSVCHLAYNAKKTHVSHVAFNKSAQWMYENSENAWAVVSSISTQWTLNSFRITIQMKYASFLRNFNLRS